jgi:hypothetical protein
MNTRVKMKEAETLLKYASEKGIEIFLTPDLRLEIIAPKGVMSPEALDYIRGSRPILLEQLCSYEFQDLVFRLIYSDDISWLVKQLKDICSLERVKIIRRYLEEFDAAYKAEENPVKKRNAGRFKANTWLREELEDETGYGQ